MPDGGGPRSLAARFWRSCLYVFGGVVLLTWTVDLICRYWWALAAAGAVAAVAAVVRWYLRRW